MARRKQEAIIERADYYGSSFELIVLPNGSTLVSVDNGPGDDSTICLPWEQVLKVFEAVQQRLDAAGLKGAREHLDNLESALDM